ncbi:MAG: hypothetical protein AAFR54_23220, partial [Planctomycetota bacterium]
LAEVGPHGKEVALKLLDALGGGTAPVSVEPDEDDLVAAAADGEFDGDFGHLPRGAETEGL